MYYAVHESVRTGIVTFPVVTEESASPCWHIASSSCYGDDS